MKNTRKAVTEFLDDKNVYRNGELVTIDRHDLYDLFVEYAQLTNPSPDRNRIVVPSDDKTRYWVEENLPFQSETSIVTTKCLIESIRTLNPGAEVVEEGE